MYSPNSMLEQEEYEALMDEQLLIPTTIREQALSFYKMYSRMNEDAKRSNEMQVPFRDVAFYSEQINCHFENCFPTDNFAVSEETCDTLARAVLALADKDGRVS